ncbi:MAG: serine hydrolase [Planctomycetota bacterium]
MFELMHKLCFAAAALMAALAFGGGQLRSQGTPELPLVREAVEKMAKRIGSDAAGLGVVWSDSVIHLGTHGGLGADTVVPIASASKWLAVATILTLVDDGTLELDLPVARYLKEFDRDDKRLITIRQCLACTGGFAARVGGRMRGWDMDTFVAKAADAPLRARPNSEFRYGGMCFQIAAAAAVRASGRSWHTLFYERIARPIGMSKTSFGALRPIASAAGTTALPWVAGGAVSTLEDYTRFVAMLVGGGRVGEGRTEDGIAIDRVVLSEKLIAEMWRDQVRPILDVRAAVGADTFESTRYGLGSWIDTRDDGAFVRVSNPGAFGWTAWIDLDLGVGGVLAIQDRVEPVLRHLGAVQQAVRDAVLSPSISGMSETLELRHDGRRRRYHLHVPPHNKNEAGMPLLVVLHGERSSGEAIRQQSRLHELGRTAGFIVAFPDGTGLLPGKQLVWNAGYGDVRQPGKKADDVGFVAALVRDVQQRVPVDGRRVFVAGHGSGGMLAHRLAREAGQVFAGVAVVAGVMNDVQRDATSGCAALLVHCDGDELVPIDGSEKGRLVGRKRSAPIASLQDAVDYYVARNDLLAYPRSETLNGVSRARYEVPRSSRDEIFPVHVVRIQGGSHAWPGSPDGDVERLGRSHKWPASQAILDFFVAMRPTKKLSAATPAVPR